MPALQKPSVVDRTKLSDEKQIQRFYSSHLLSTPEFVIPHDTKRLAEQPRPWWFREKKTDEDD